MIEDLGSKTSAGDVVLLHACCHNPTGVDPNQRPMEPDCIADHRKATVAPDRFRLPRIREGLEEDTVAIAAILAPTRKRSSVVPFPRTSDCIGKEPVRCHWSRLRQATARAAQSQFKRVVRCNYSNPPRHGAAIVATVLADQGLTEQWHEELTEMRERIKRSRISSSRP